MRRRYAVILALPLMPVGLVMAAYFKEAGLGTNQNINYTLTAQPTATYVRSTRATTGTSPPR